MPDIDIRTNAAAIIAGLSGKGIRVFLREGKLAAQPSTRLTDEDRAAIAQNREILVASLMPPPSLTADATMGLEPLLSAIQRKASKLTKDQTLLEAVSHLLDDCRAFLSEGRLDTAIAIARHLSVSIPEYFGSFRSRTP